MDKERDSFREIDKRNVQDFLHYIWGNYQRGLQSHVRGIILLG